MTPEPSEVTEARNVVAEAGDTDMDNIGLLSATLAHIDALTERLAEVERERDEARAYMPTWKRLGRTGGQVTYTLEVAGRSLAHFVSQKDGTWYSGQQREHDTIEAAAKSICAALRIPYVPVPDGI